MLTKICLKNYFMTVVHPKEFQHVMLGVWDVWSMSLHVTRSYTFEVMVMVRAYKAKHFVSRGYIVK